MQAQSRFDDLFFTITREAGGLEGLLNSLFSFLIRRTDFFYEADPGDKMGFPPGYSQKMVLDMMNAYQQEHYKKYPRKDPAEYNAKLKKLQEAKEAKEKEAKEKSQQENKQPAAQPAVPTTTETKAPTNVKPAETKEATSTQPTEKIPEEKTTTNTTTTAPKIDQKFKDISTYNGAASDKYNWSQALNEVTVQIPVPAGTRAKNLAVEMTPKKLKVVLKSENRTLLEGEWYERIKVDDSTWSVDDDSLVLNIEKGNENIWKTVLKGDEEIDATKVDNSKPIESFDHETQGALRKIMYEQQRKQAGLPTTEEEAQQEMLKKAWNAEGSPFKGQPFDPSKFNLSGGMGGMGGMGGGDMNFGN